MHLSLNADLFRLVFALMLDLHDRELGCSELKITFQRFESPSGSGGVPLRQALFYFTHRGSLPQMN
jgi:hypothetical protein